MSEIHNSSSPSNVTCLLQEIDILSIDFNKESNHEIEDEEETYQEQNGESPVHQESEMEFCQGKFENRVVMITNPDEYKSSYPSKGTSRVTSRVTSPSRPASSASSP